MIAATCLALNIYFEARSEAMISQFAVAQVTMNRVASSRYPDSVCDVVWQRKQFSLTHDGKSDRPKDANAWANAKWVADLVLKDHDKSLYVVPTDVTHYHADYVKPYWASAYTKVAQIGKHIFYRGKA